MWCLRRQNVKKRKRTEDEEGAAAAAATSGVAGTSNTEQDGHLDAGLLERGGEMPPPSYDSVPKEGYGIIVGLEKHGIISRRGSRDCASKKKAPAAGGLLGQRNAAVLKDQRKRVEGRGPVVRGENTIGATVNPADETAGMADELTGEPKMGAWWMWWKTEKKSGTSVR
jgi:hypothetical protein